MYHVYKSISVQALFNENDDPRVQIDISAGIIQRARCTAFTDRYPSKQYSTSTIYHVYKSISVQALFNEHDDPRVQNDISASIVVANPVQHAELKFSGLDNNGRSVIWASTASVFTADRAGIVEF